MLREDFKDETTNNQTSEQPRLTELEQKYEKELNEYEEKTHFMQEHELDYEAEGSSVITNGATNKNNFSEEKRSEKKERPSNESYSDSASESEESAPITINELLEKGAEALKEKAGEVWENVKSEWKSDRKEFVRKTLVRTAVTGAAIGLILLSRRKKQKTGFMGNLINAK